ncbi:MAG: S9 family peptidase [Actinomycetota bacterium]|nr:S9 family peptidase [Actinomycetota bacterium]
MTELLRSLLATPSAYLADVVGGPGGDRVLVRSDLSGTMQLYELEVGRRDGRAPQALGPTELLQLTELPEPVGTACYLPGGQAVVAEMDRGGDERHQLYLLRLGGADATDRGLDDPEGERPAGGGSEPADRQRSRPAGSEALVALTSDPRHGHHLAGVSPDGTLVAYVSNRANGVDFDLWVCVIATGEHRLVHAGGAWLQAGAGFSPDGRWVSVLRPGPRPLDTDLILVELDSGRVVVAAPHPDEAALVGPAVWADQGTWFASSNVGRDRSVVVAGGTTEQPPVVVPGSERDWDVEPADSAGAGGRIELLVVENRGGASHLGILDPAGARPPESVELPEPGVVHPWNAAAPRFSPDARRVYLTLSTPRRPPDVWVWDRDRGETSRLTSTPVALAPDQLAAAEVAEAISFDGERIPLLVLRPGPQDPTVASPVVVLVHGGPESQSERSWNPLSQALVSAGYAVVVPNVRGSTGYGKRYASLDDTTKRLDAVRDLAAVHAWVGADHRLDAGRCALWGGSYGGYMVLAGLAFQPELWAAGVDIVGISDLVTFLENTSEYRRAHREREYGSLSTDRAFLEEASPLRRADAIRAPLFVVHGRNDPRVPVGEAEQLASRLRGRGVRCELSVYDDEGHGLARLANRLDAYRRAVAFLDEVLATS